MIKTPSPCSQINNLACLPSGAHVPSKKDPRASDKKPGDQRRRENVPEIHPVRNGSLGGVDVSPEKFQDKNKENQHQCRVVSGNCDFTTAAIFGNFPLT